MKRDDELIKTMGEAEGQDYINLVPEESVCGSCGLFCRILTALCIATLIVAAVTVTIVSLT